MSRQLIFLLLMLTTLALAEGKPRTQRAASTTAQKKNEATQVRAEHAQANTEHAKAETEVAPKEDENDQAQSGGDSNLVSVPGGKALGMSILGNQDAPKSLVIVPWKSSELGESPGISPMLDDSRQPVDKEVFMRALRYYEIRSETKR